MNKRDTITNWYEKVDSSSKKIKPDRNYKNHLIKPCMMITIIGPTGSGKTNALLEFLARKNNSFYSMIIFSGSTTDEPLYNMLSEKMDGVELIDNISDLPDLTDMNDDDKTQEKLIVFDDIINLKPIEKVKLQKWFNSARKYGYTCICMAQNFADLPTQIRRNTMIYILFKMNDINTIKHILKTHSHTSIPVDVVLKMYQYATHDKGNFFKIDFTSDHPFTKNFIETLDPRNFS